MKTEKYIFIFLLLFNSFSFSQNLIQNYSFEQNGQPWGNYWFVRQWGPPCSQSIEITNASIDTTCGMTFIQDPSPDGGNWALQSFNASLSYNLLNLPIGQKFQFSFWAKGGLDINLQFRINSIYAKNYNFNTTNQWTKYTVEDTIPLNVAPTDTFSLNINTWLFNDFGGFIVDNFEFNVLLSNSTIPSTNQKKNEVYISSNNSIIFIEFNIQEKMNRKDIILYDMLGQPIYIFKNIKREFEIPVQDGVYILQILSEKEIISRKIVVK